MSLDAHTPWSEELLLRLRSMGEASGRWSVKWERPNHPVACPCWDVCLSPVSEPSWAYRLKLPPARRPWRTPACISTPEGPASAQGDGLPWDERGEQLAEALGACWLLWTWGEDRDLFPGNVRSWLGPCVFPWEQDAWVGHIQRRAPRRRPEGRRAQRQGGSG